jgi:hypothetical protein
MRCAACGGEEFVHGELTDAGSGGMGVAFKLPGAPLLKRLFHRAERAVSAHGCVACGHLQLYVHFNAEDLARQAEGAPTDAAER